MLRPALATACLIISLTAAHSQSLRQTTVKGLLIIQLPNGEHAGSASQMNATVMPGENGKFSLRFNQGVGPQMMAATDEVIKLLSVRHPDNLPRGKCIEFGFADKHSPKDGPSAAVACALMAESILTGKSLDQSFAVTGDITATGEVRPIGGVGAKLRGAVGRDCKIMAVPKKNQPAVQDIYVLEGIEAVAKCQVILIESFDEAWKIAQADKSEEIQQAIKDYEMVQDAIARKPGNATHPMVIEKLKAVLKAIPNHESARLLALHGMRKGPDKLSLAGSLESIQQAAIELDTTLTNGSYLDRGTDDPLWNSVAKMQRLRASVDPRTKDYLTAFLDAANFIKTNRTRSNWSDDMIRELRSMVGKIEVEENKLINNRAIQEELLSQ